MWCIIHLCRVYTVCVILQYLTDQEDQSLCDNLIRISALVSQEVIALPYKRPDHGVTEHNYVGATIEQGFIDFSNHLIPCRSEPSQ